MRSIHDRAKRRFGYAGICQAGAAFTLVESLVALAILTIILGMVFQIVSRTSFISNDANSKLEQFREARMGFATLPEWLSKATLDQYFGYEYKIATLPVMGNVPVPQTCGRRSELRFICGPVSEVMKDSSVASATHAVFFTAPLGFSGDTAYSGLRSLLNVCGYFIQWSNVDPERPAILSGTSGYRFRLMQFIQPAESMGLYATTCTAYPTYKFVSTSDWQTQAMQRSPQSVYSLANNVVALLLLPSMSTSDTSGDLAPQFKYDSQSQNPNAELSQRNRLPPVIRLIMYTIDEASAKRIENSPTVPDLYGSLFTDAAKLYPSTDGDPGDLARFESVLREKKLNYRRFETAIEMPPQPWSKQPDF